MEERQWRFFPVRFKATILVFGAKARLGGVVSGYVWDFGAELSPSGPFRLGMREGVAELREQRAWKHTVAGLAELLG